MKILYVTPLVCGFEDLLRGERNSKGLPSFIYPLKKFYEDGHEVDIVLISNFHDEIDIKVDWIKKENIIANFNNDITSGSRLNRMINTLKTTRELNRFLKEKISSRKYDFVYCHGTAAVTANMIASKFRVPCGYRLYGTIGIASFIREHGKMRAMLKYPKYFLIFNLKKNFMVITDDGTDGDFVYNAFAITKNYPLYFWTNGIDKTYDPNEYLAEVPECQYLFHAGRIERIKRQDRVIDVLHDLHAEGYMLHLFFAGHVSDENYLNELYAQIEKYELKDYVHFLGAVDRRKMQTMSANAVATVLLGDVSNKGNVFLECAIAGARIITFEEKSLQKYIVTEKTGYMVKSEHDAAQVITRLIVNQNLADNIQSGIRDTMMEKLMTWDERVEMEEKLILNCCNN